MLDGVKKIALLFVLQYFCLNISAARFTISGYVRDAGSSESLIGANVYLDKLMKGTVTNTYGFYSLTIDEGSYTIVASFIGYGEQKQTIKLDKDIKLNFSLQPKAIQTKEVVITGERSDKNVKSAEMSRVKMDIEKIKQLPAFLGEVDVLKTIQLLPGVQSAGEGNTGFYVRGGGPDQNLILIDEAPLYNASHLFGFFSTINADAVKNIELIKGGMPANYGGRLASVLDISMKEGNMKTYHAKGGIGLISSRITAEGPIKKDTASFILSARRTYIDIIAAPFIPDSSAFKGSGYFFYDLNAKVNYRISDKDRVFLSGYYGKDVFTFSSDNDGFSAKIPWGNATASARWNHLFNNKLFLNNTFVFSDYQFEFGATQSDFEFKLFSGIRDFTGKMDFNWFPSIRHNVKFGAQYTYHIFTPSNVSAKQGDTEFNVGDISHQYAHEAAVYVNDAFDLTEKIRINAGLRYALFEQVGPFTRYTKDDQGSTTDSTVYSTGQQVAMYHGPEPRLTIRYAFNSRQSVKMAVTRNLQFVHMASISSVSLPTDIWVPSSDLVKPQIGYQYAVGYFHNFLDNSYEGSVELYYKDMANQIEYAEGALPEDNIGANPDNQFTFGKGTSYGAEFFIKKRTGKFNGWIGYTISKTEKTFEAINNGNTYPAKYDRRHDLSVVLAYKLAKRWECGGVFVYATGNALTLPVQRYVFEGNIVNAYGERNSYRMKPYHRMDLSITFKGKKGKKFKSDWVLSVYNVYNRANPFFIYFDNEGNANDGTLKITAKQVSLFPILPSLTWNFKF